MTKVLHYTLNLAYIGLIPSIYLGLKIYFNRQPVIGPWGGGNKTLTAITSKMTELGHDVVFNLEENIDTIFSDTNSFGYKIQGYKDTSMKRCKDTRHTYKDTRIQGYKAWPFATAPGRRWRQAPRPGGP